MAYDDDSHMEPHTHRMAQLTFNIDTVIIVFGNQKKFDDLFCKRIRVS